jgi:ubiquinone/menaquinone biosynthesis C-methylase UbiE
MLNALVAGVISPMLSWSPIALASGMLLFLRQSMRRTLAQKISPKMRISDPSADRVCDEYVIVKSLLPLSGAHVLELGCGKAEKTRAIAQGGQVASITALEVDEIQHAKNLQIGDLPNVSFCFGGAEAIPAADASFDIVLMFKSLHHVPMDKVDQALAEIRRVLKPGGLAYLSESVYAGEFNDILRLFHDEKTVREAAFAAIQRAVHGGTLEPVGQTFFNTPGHFDDFEQFEEQVLKVTHTHHQLSPEVYEAVRVAFMRHMTPQGVDFQHPIRVDLLRKTTL